MRPSSPCSWRHRSDRPLDTPLGGRVDAGVMTVLLTIGEFSRMTHLSVKALRHYHDVGLLEPADMDNSTGHWLYAARQVPTAQLVRRFRDLEMPLEDVRSVLLLPIRLRATRHRGALRTHGVPPRSDTGDGGLVARATPRIGGAFGCRVSLRRFDAN